MPPAFLAIGHFCQDVTPNGYTIGGGAAYSTVTARNLGLGTHAVTSVAEDFNRKNPVLDRINVTYHDSIETTIFDNQYDQYGKRHQKILGIGDKLQPSHIPIELQNTGIVYLCPIADEVDPELVRCFKHCLIGVTPQGWMRQWGSSRQVRPKRWDTAEKILSHTDILVLSDEDFLNNFPFLSIIPCSNAGISSQSVTNCEIILYVTNVSNAREAIYLIFLKSSITLLSN